MTFVPSTITVAPGEPVCWTWSANGVTHNVNADDGSFLSGPPASQGDFQRTFTAAGTFAYHCQIHGSPVAGMRGVVVVGDGGSEPPPPQEKQLRLGATAYTVAEGASVEVAVERLGDPAGAASVNYDQSGGSAKLGTDYTRRKGTLKWASGEGGAKVFQIGTKADQLVEGNEAFSVKLSKPKGPPLGDSVATVTIDDANDCPSTTPAAEALSARGRSESEIEVSWSPQHGAVGTANSWLERRSPGGPFEILPVSTAHGHFLDRGLEPAAVYQYRIRSESADGSSAISRIVLAATDAKPSRCSPSAGETCLSDGRFAAAVSFAGGEASTAGPRWHSLAGPAERAASTDGAVFRADGKDILVRVTNGCAENGHFWVAVAALSDAEFTVRVRDTRSGRAWIHHGVSGSEVMGGGRLDRDAFVCGSD